MADIRHWPSGSGSLVRKCQVSSSSSVDMVVGNGGGGSGTKSEICEFGGVNWRL